MKILVFGLPSSGKTTLANKLAKKLDAEHLNADAIRTYYNDWDFSTEGRDRQAARMQELANASEKPYVVMDFVCPLRRYRKTIEADIVVFMDTIQTGRYEDTNKLFQRPEDEEVTYHFVDFDSDAQCEEICKRIITFDWRKETVQMLGRWQPWHDGHFALFERCFAKTGQVCIQVRDCQGWNNSNPFNFEKVKDNIVKDLKKKGYTYNREYIIQLVPNIVNITYGRDVGYKIEQEEFPESITKISATEIRKALGCG